MGFFNVWKMGCMTDNWWGRVGGCGMIGVVEGGGGMGLGSFLGTK